VKFRFNIIHLLFVVIIVAMIGTLFRPHGFRPLKYQGKRLRDWGKELNHEDQAVRQKAIDVLLEATTDSRARIREEAASLLYRASDDPRVLPTLIGRLKDEDALVRFMAIDAIGRIGPAANEAVPALTEAQSDVNESVRSHALQALRKIRPEEAADKEDKAVKKTKE
jgi:HEAT repeat protein